MRVKILMGLKESDLRSLIESRAPALHIAKAVLPQMLQALCHLETMEIIRRDVKPENILYTSNPDGSYHFQLCDFGQCRYAKDANGFAGTASYIAPEVSKG